MKGYSTLPERPGLARAAAEEAGEFAHAGPGDTKRPGTMDNICEHPCVHLSGKTRTLDFDKPTGPVALGYGRIGRCRGD